VDIEYVNAQEVTIKPSCAQQAFDVFGDQLREPLQDELADRHQVAGFIEATDTMNHTPSDESKQEPLGLEEGEAKRSARTDGGEDESHG